MLSFYRRVLIRYLENKMKANEGGTPSVIVRIADQRIYTELKSLHFMTFSEVVSSPIFKPSKFVLIFNEQYRASD
jgi:hypothetical protein